MGKLVNQDLNLASLANLQRSFNQLGDLIALADVCLADDRLGTVRLNFLCNLLRTLLATRGNVVDNDVCTTLSQEDGNAGTNSAIGELSAI